MSGSCSNCAWSFEEEGSEGIAANIRAFIIGTRFSYNIRFTIQLAINYGLVIYVPNVLCFFNISLRATDKDFLGK